MATKTVVVDEQTMMKMRLLQDASSTACPNTDEDLNEDMECMDWVEQHSSFSFSDPSGSPPSDTGHDAGDSGETTANRKSGPSSTEKKRKPGTDRHGNTKPAKKRASQACEICRSRKVRCDSEKRHPCTNCADMGLKCSIPESKRRR